MSYSQRTSRGNIFHSSPSRTVLLLEAMRNQFNLGSRALFCTWLLLMILIPHILRLGDRTTLLVALSLSILVQVGLILSLFVPVLRVRGTLGIGLLVVAAAWLVEFIGHETGFPFGRYTYTEALQPQVGGVPIQIPAAWLMMLFPAWAVGSVICSKGRGADRSLSWTNRAVATLTSGLAFTAWDLFLDPQMVAWNIWRWELPGRYFGIPAVNFIGWTLVSAAFLFGLSLLPRTRSLPLEALLLVYTTVWLLNTVGLGLYFEMPGAAATGFLGMGVFVALAWRQVLASPE